MRINHVFNLAVALIVAIVLPLAWAAWTWRGEIVGWLALIGVLAIGLVVGLYFLAMWWIEHY